MKELEFDSTSKKHIVLLPGLLAPVYYLFPLVRYLRKNQKEYGVTAVPLRLSVAGFDSIVARAENAITKNLLERCRPQKIILFGHSHGGRVASELAPKLKKIYPDAEYSVITTGSPFGRKLNYLSRFRKLFYSVSKAYREWPRITQPDSSILKNYVRYYSNDDRIVIPEMAKADYTGELIELKGVSHNGLSSPSVMGPMLLELLKSFR